jgi:outer membrane receptor for ferrienterochelin and colicins
MKHTIVLMLLIHISAGIIAQEKSDAMLFGDVKTASDKVHIPYASILVKGTRLGTHTDASGHFKLAHLPLGKNIIVAQVMGFKSQEKEVFMEKGKAVQLFFELEEDALFLNQVVVTGTRTEHYVKDVPVKTEVITAREIENKNAFNLYQALEGTPGIRVENQCQYCNFTMIRMQGLGAEHTQVLINGQPMYSGLASVYGLQQMSTIDVDKIEVVKGAGSALYGSGAIAGAINIISKEPSFVPETKIDIQFGSYNTNRYDISSSMRNEKGNIGLGIFAQKYTEDAIDETGPGSTRKEVMHKDGISDRVSSNLSNAGFSAYFDDALIVGDKLVLQGKAIFETREGGTLIDDYYKNPFTDGTENIKSDRYEASVNYLFQIKKASQLKFNLAYVNHQRTATNDSYLGDFMDTHNDSVPDLRDMRPYLAQENTWTSTLSFNARAGNHNIIIGAQAFYTILEESGMYVVVDTANVFLGQSYRSIADKHAREYGFFIQDEWEISKKLTMVQGIRFDHHYSEEKYVAEKEVFESGSFPKSQFDQSTVNPRIAIKYAWSDKLVLRANAGTGFRAPYGFSEDLHLCSGSPRVWKSSALKPEKSVSVNISTDYYAENIRLSANFFRTELKDKIAFIDAGDNISALGYDYQWDNIDDAFVQGIEFSVMANMMKTLALGLDWTFNQGAYKNPREDWLGTDYEKESRWISRFPTLTGNMKIQYSPKTWTFILMGDYQGSMYIDYYNEEQVFMDRSKIKKTEGFFLLNARIAKEFDHFTVYTGLNNIFNYVQDEKYLDDAAFIYAPLYGRMFYAGVRLRLSH